MALLEVNDIHAFYGNIHALKGVTISVDEGEIVSFIGGNGAGGPRHFCQAYRARKSGNGRIPSQRQR